MIMTPSDMTIGDEAQVSPAMHSADTPHNWSPDAHDPAWQLAVKLRVKQQTWPGKQPAEVMHARSLTPGAP